MVFAAPARVGRGCLRMRNLQGRTNKIYLRGKLFPGIRTITKKYTYSAKNALFQHFFFSFPQKKNNKDYIKTLDTEQNADYTIMDWVY